MRRGIFILASCALLFASPADAAKRNVKAAAKLDLISVNAAEFGAGSGKRISPALIKAEILLDRAAFSPGEIDGREGDNLTKALAAFQKSQGLGGDGKLDRGTWDKLVATSGDPVLVEYALTKGDVGGPFTEKIPLKMEEMADLPHLGYRNGLEALGEKFHMSPALLKALNPGQGFKTVGDSIVVANVPQPDPKRKEAMKGTAARIEVDKDARLVRAFDKSGKLLAFYPATIGSEEKPAPSGSFKVVRVALNPTYTYNPKYAFKGVKAKEPFTIAAGPNNPVGAVWIDIDAPSYGIHGTPEPDKISKRSSHGCVRLTNWDALALAAMAGKGTEVVFLGESQPQSVSAKP